MYLRTSPVLGSWFVGSLLRGYFKRNRSLLGLADVLLFLFKLFLGIFRVRPIFFLNFSKRSFEL